MWLSKSSDLPKKLSSQVPIIFVVTALRTAQYIVSFIMKTKLIGYDERVYFYSVFGLWVWSFDVLYFKDSYSALRAYVGILSFLWRILLALTVKERMYESLLGGNVGDEELILGEWVEPGTGGERKKFYK